MENGLADTDLASLKRMAQEGLDMGVDSRNRATLCLQYYHKKQLTAEEKAALRKRKQPDTVINRVRTAVNGTLGVLQQGQTDPKAWPRNPGDEESADVATKTLRYISDVNEFDELRISCARDYLIQHSAAAILGVDGKGRPTIEDIAPEEFLFDPRSRKEDFRDARYLGIAKWIYADELIAMHPGKSQEIDAAIEAGPAISVDSTLEDRPSGGSPWVDRRRRRLMTVELYYRDKGKLHRALFHAGGVLEGGVSPYVDGDGEPTCPIVAQSCYVDDENVRYGVVYDMLDYQDGINKRHSKSLHAINERQVRVGLNYAGDPDKARTEMSRPDGVIIGAKDDVEVLQTRDIVSGNMQMLQLMMGEMERAGPNPAVLGRGSESQSGRANLVRQQAGLVELAVVFAGIESWERRIYRKAWEIARQFWKAADFIRVTDEEGAPQFVGINQPIPGPPQVVMGEGGMPTIQPTVLGYENALAELDVDITLDSVPDTATLQQEQFATLTELAKIYGPQEVPFDDMLLLSSMTDKSKLLERRKARKEEAAQGMQPQQQLGMASAQAEIENTQADTAKKIAETQKIQFGAITEAYRVGATG